jgi:hypothetical protein
MFFWLSTRSILVVDPFEWRLEMDIDTIQLGAGLDHAVLIQQRLSGVGPEFVQQQVILVDLQDVAGVVFAVPGESYRQRRMLFRQALEQWNQPGWISDQLTVRLHELGSGAYSGLHRNGFVISSLQFISNYWLYLDYKCRNGNGGAVF